MKFKILLFTSIRALIKHKIRTFLTVLGIMIGIASIIITLSIGRGAEQAVTAQITGMGEGAIYIIPAGFLKRGSIRSDIVQKIKLTTNEVKMVKKNCPEIQAISPMQITEQQLEYKQNISYNSVIGCYPDMVKISSNFVGMGHFFNNYHVKQKSNVVVLGHNLAKKLFNSQSAIGKIILLNKQPFQVIGVLSKKDNFFGQRDPNDWAYIPFTTAKKICRGPHEAEEDITGMGIKPYKDVNADVLLRKIKNILRFAYKTKHGQEDQFTVFSQKSIEEVARNAAGIIKMFGLIAALIALLVGSIGVMNIMLVSVKERTKEIGLRMAIGATQSSIRKQFLIESTALCLFGGIMGAILGLTGQILISNAATLPVTIEIAPIIGSLIITVFIGIFFGYYPAYQASQLNPVDALLERT